MAVYLNESTWQFKTDLDELLNATYLTSPSPKMMFANQWWYY